MKRKITLCLISPLFLLCSIPTSTKADTIFDTCHKTPYTIQTVITEAGHPIILPKQKQHICVILPGPYYRVFPLLPLLPMMVQPLAALAVLQMPLLLLQLGQLNLCHLPKAETLLLHMQQQHILLQVHQKILRKALLFHVVKMVPFHNLFKSFFDII